MGVVVVVLVLTEMVCGGVYGFSEEKEYLGEEKKHLSHFVFVGASILLLVQSFLVPFPKRLRSLIVDA